MLLFPNAKINLGLAVTQKRSDGYHNLQTVFYPVALSDILEFVEDPGLPKGKLKLKLTGIRIEGEPMDNLCAKAYYLLHNEYKLPGLSVHLHKIIPIGAGLGGGSSDAAFMLRGLNNHFNLNIPVEKLEEYASRLGSDCTFFIRNQPLFAFEKGDKFRDIPLTLDACYIMLVHPGIHITTAEAYTQIIPAVPEKSPETIVQLPLEEWKNELKNDFEKHIFRLYPEISMIKDNLYRLGAKFAALSGSGSCVFGIFSEMPEVPDEFLSYFHWCGKMKSQIE